MTENKESAGDNLKIERLLASFKEGNITEAQLTETFDSDPIKIHLVEAETNESMLEEDGSPVAFKLEPELALKSFQVAKDKDATFEETIEEIFHKGIEHYLKEDFK